MLVRVYWGLWLITYTQKRNKLPFWHFEPTRVNPIKLSYDPRQSEGRPHRGQRL